MLNFSQEVENSMISTQNYFSSSFDPFDIHQIFSIFFFITLVTRCFFFCAILFKLYITIKTIHKLQFYRIKIILIYTYNYFCFLKYFSFYHILL